jgi:hypothetical protein
MNRVGAGLVGPGPFASSFHSGTRTDTSQSLSLSRRSSKRCPVRLRERGPSSGPLSASLLANKWPAPDLCYLSTLPYRLPAKMLGSGALNFNSAPKFPACGGPRDFRMDSTVAGYISAAPERFYRSNNTGSRPDLRRCDLVFLAGPD